MKKNAAAKNKHSTLWGIACRTIFYSSSPKLHVAQILGGETLSEECSHQHNKRIDMHRSGPKKKISAHPYSSPCSSFFGRTEVHFELMCFTCLICRKMRRWCQSISIVDLQLGLAKIEWFCPSDVVGKAAAREESVAHPLAWGFVWSKEVHFNFQQWRARCLQLDIPAADRVKQAALRETGVWGVAWTVNYQ